MPPASATAADVPESIKFAARETASARSLQKDFFLDKKRTGWIIKKRIN
jgi:hypothetical protein